MSNVKYCKCKWHLSKSSQTTQLDWWSPEAATLILCEKSNYCSWQNHISLVLQLQAFTSHLKNMLSHVWFWNIVPDCFLPVSTAARLNEVSVLGVLCRPRPLVLANRRVSSRPSHLSIKNCCVAALALHFYISAWPSFTGKGDSPFTRDYYQFIHEISIQGAEIGDVG